jgi:tripartite-type tricarboxylate transporter receptor subunit TctC
VIAGNVQLTFEAASPLLGHIRDGRLRALAVLSEARLADLPDVPSAAESGYPTVAATTWTGLFAPAGTDKAIVDKLNATLNEGLKSVELKAALARVGNAPLGGTPDALTRMLLAENARWAPIVKALSLKAD